MHVRAPLLLLLSLSCATAIPLFTAFDVDAEWASFQAKFGKSYGDVETTAMRQQIFRDNLNFINTWNSEHSAPTDVKVSINEFADLTHTEFKAFYLGYRPSARARAAASVPNCTCQSYAPFVKPNETDYCEDESTGVCYDYYSIVGCSTSITNWTHCSAGGTPPSPPTPPTPPPGPSPPSPPSGDSVDWVKKGAVTPVKNQAQCGSCWAFSTTGSMEGAIFIKYGVLESLSEQELVSCDKVDHGCQRGAMDNGFTFAKRNGLPTEKDYPYTSGTGSTGTCKSQTFTPANHSKVASYTDVGPNSEAALKTAVAKGPVSVAIEADKQVFQFYKSGVIKASAGCGTNLDHGVLAVGYGTQDGTMYWKVKNSWGATWGDDGYVLLERTDSTDSKGTCGIAMDPSYPTMV